MINTHAFRPAEAHKADPKSLIIAAIKDYRRHFGIAPTADDILTGITYQMSGGEAGHFAAARHLAHKHLTGLVDQGSVVLQPDLLDGPNRYDLAD